jgi:hypothetical protein
MNKYGLLILIFFAGCTTIQEAGMNEWDYKALEAGYTMECRCCGETPSCKWVDNGPSINGTNSSDN